MNISVLGCGRWGSLIGWYLSKINHDVCIWGLSDAPQYKELSKTRRNNLLSFDDDVIITDDLQKAVNRSNVIVISISAQNLRIFMESLCKQNLKDKIIVLCMKGIEESTGKRLSQVVEDYVNPSDTKIAVWIGPGHVQDFIQNIPTCMVIDSKSDEVKKYLIKEFSSKQIRFYYGDDLVGNEVGAAAKNVMGIAAGMLDGLGWTSLKGPLMSRGTKEISELIEKMGGKAISAYGLAHLGDYQATLFSEYSNNRTFGQSIVQNKTYDKLAEGVSTVKALVKLGGQYSLELPICNTVNDIINKRISAKNGLKRLFDRPLKNEF